jgi:molybdopterin converting factor small subunit
MSTVVLPRSLVALVNGSERRSQVEGATVGDALVALDARWPGLLDRVCEPGPVLRRHLNVFVDGERAGLATPLPPGATLHVIPAVSGGSRRPR